MINKDVIEENMALMPITTDKAKLAMWLWENIVSPVVKKKDARIKELEDWGTQACIRSENLFQLRDEDQIKKANMESEIRKLMELLERANSYLSPTNQCPDLSTMIAEALRKPVSTPIINLKD